MYIRNRLGFRGLPLPRATVARRVGAALCCALTAIAPSYTPIPARAADPVVLVGAGGARVYIAEPGTASLLLVRRDGTVSATRRLDAAATALALDGRRGLLYVAERGGGIAVLSNTSLGLVRALHATIATTALSAVPGRNALYIFDTARGRPLLLTYTLTGAVTLAPVFKRIAAPSSPRVHMAIEIIGQRHRARGAYWANGFHPGEPVSVSWGASDQGIVYADAYGLVRGTLSLRVPARPHVHSMGLYGLSSRRSLTTIVTVAPPAPAARRTTAAAPTLVLGFIPGPVVTLAPPRTHRALRVPAAAGAPLIPLLLGALLLRGRRKRRKRRRQAAASKTSPTPLVPLVDRAG